MSPRGKAKAKKEVGENGSERKTPVRQSRTVKAASYKDLSDSEDDKPIKKRKQESDSESLSEEEKPKSKAKGRGRQPRAKKNVSESEEGSEFVSSEESSDGESARKRRQPARQPARSLRAQRGPSYKDLSDSEEDFDAASKSSSDQEEEVKKRKEPAGSRKRGRPAKGSSKASKEKSDASGSDGENDDEEKSAEEKISDEEDADEKKENSKVKEDLKVKEDPEEKEGSKTDNDAKEKEVTSIKVEKKPKPEHDLSEEDEGEGEGEEGSEDEDTHKESNDSKKRGRPEKSAGEKKPPAKKAKVEDKPKMNKTDTDYASIDFSSDSKTKGGEPWNLKISSWNVAGLRTWIQKGGLDFIKYENPDIVCLQETKCSEKKLPPEAKVEGYESYWLTGEKEGYAGVALLSKVKPLNVEYGLGKPEFDTEGRVITAEFEKFYVVTAYVVNAGQGLKTLPKRLEWDPVFRAHLKKLDEKKPVILCGDLNVAHSEIDLANPKTNTKSAGFTPQEREGMTELLKEGFVDTFRHLYPDKKDAYSFWTYMSNARSRNVGWRLDYFITSERFLPNVCDNVIRSEVYGSDHCPITFFVRV